MINLLDINQMAKEINEARKRLEAIPDRKLPIAAAAVFNLQSAVDDGQHLLDLANRHRAVRAQGAA